jgi:transposase
MEVGYEGCGGVDVHAKTVVACLVTKGRKEIRTFATMTDELLQRGDWLSSAGCTPVAIESTGVYWKPVFTMLEGLLTVLLVNARHIKAVPGRKTDVRDCEWLADLLRHGLLKASFIPPLEIREVRGIGPVPADSSNGTPGRGQSDYEAHRERHYQAGTRGQ